MQTDRLEAFSDGVLAIIITIMVLELHVPEHHDWAGLWHESGLGLLGYVLSFIYIGIYWNNHHHMFHVTERVSGGMLWSNLHLLFWLSLIPFTTNWMDESTLARVPTTAYGVNLLLAGAAYVILQSRIYAAEGPDGPLRRALGRDNKGRLSLVLYVMGIAFATLSGDETRWATVVAIGFYVAVAIMWVIPDRRIERSFA